MFFFLGFLNPTTLEVTYRDFNDLSLKKSRQISVLISFSNGVQAEVYDFEYEQDGGAGSLDFVGVDNIVNDSPGYLVQRSIYERQIKESRVVVAQKNEYFRVAGSIGLKLKISLDARLLGQTSTIIDDAVGDIKTTSITVIREVHVKPFATVQVKSSLATLIPLLQYNSILV